MNILKKTVSVCLCAATLCAGAFAAGSAKTPTVYVNGKALDMNGIPVAAYTDNGNTMVPLRRVAESLGYKVSWDAANKCAVIEDDDVRLPIYLNQDSYASSSKKAIGMTAPQSYGSKATILKDGYTFIPAKAFELMYVAVTDKDGVVTIKSGNSAQIPNPIVEYKTLAEAEKAAGFTAKTSAYFKNIAVERVATIEKLIEIDYADGVTYRMVPGSEDISGNYNNYASIKTLKIGAYTVTAKGDGKTVSLATFSDGTYSYSFDFETGVSESALTQIVSTLA